MMAKRYFITFPGKEEAEVSQDVYCLAEQANGFHPKPGCGPEATGSFHGPSGTKGRIEYDVLKED